MKIKINILPDEQKEKRAQAEKIGLILRFGFSIIFVLLVLAVTLGLIQFILNLEYQDAKKISADNSGRAVSNTGADEEFFKNLSAKVKKINKIQSELPRWSRVLAKIADICPAEIKITSVHVEQLHVKLSGFSKSREAFLSFQGRLKTEDLKNINSPISNLVAPKDFKFEVDFDIDKKFLDKLPGE